jgi:hypothetical protein
MQLDDVFSITKLKQPFWCKKKNMSSKLDVGDVVICVNDVVKADAMEEIARKYRVFVLKDKKYTIREFLNNNGIVVGVLLEEISNPKVYARLVGKFQEPAFAIWRFRKALPSEMEEVEESAENIGDEVLEEIMELIN